MATRRLSSLASGRIINRIVSKPVDLRSQLFMGDITSANTISLLRVLQKEPGWKWESLSEVSKHASQVFCLLL